MVWMFWLVKLVVHTAAGLLCKLVRIHAVLAHTILQDSSSAVHTARPEQ
jgi:hypothetical protein